LANQHYFISTKKSWGEGKGGRLPVKLRGGKREGNAMMRASTPPIAINNISERI